MILTLVYFSGFFKIKISYLFSNLLKNIPIIKYRIIGGEKNFEKERIAKTISVNGYNSLDIKELAEITFYDLRNRKGINLKAINQHMTAAGLTRSRYELLKKLSIPTLIIHGTSDPVIPIAHADKLLQLIPNAERLWIIDAGHQFPFPNLNEIQSKMIDWINDI